MILNFRFNITKNRIKNIDVWKRKHGKFININEILEVEGFGIKVLDNFCKSIINGENHEKLVKTVTKKVPQFTIPLLYEHIRTTIESCVSVHIGVSSVTWTRFFLHPDQPCEVTHWNHFDISEKKLHLSDFVQIVLYINSLLPEADVYVLENPQMAQPSAPGSPVQININIQKSQLVSMLSIILANRNLENTVYNQQEETSEDDEANKVKPQQKVLFLKPFIASRLFGLYIGNERVSTESVILELLRVHYNVDDADDLSNPVEKKEIVSKINVPIDLRSYYSETESFQKEYLGQSLLMGLCFVRLCVLKCLDSIDIVTSRSRK